LSNKNITKHKYFVNIHTPSGLMRMLSGVALGFVWEFEGEGKEGHCGKRNIGENWKKIHIFLKSVFLENDKLVFMINIF